MLNKELTLYERDENNKLIPQKVKLDLIKKDRKEHPELKDVEIKMIPMKRGKLKRIFGMDGKVDDTKPDTNRDEDGEIIKEHCIEPKYTDEDLKFLKPHIVRSIVRTIFSESGVKFNDKAGTRNVDDEDEFGKN